MKMMTSIMAAAAPERTGQLSSSLLMVNRSGHPLMRLHTCNAIIVTNTTEPTRAETAAVMMTSIMAAAALEWTG